jgi:hypothetical protein
VSQLSDRMQPVTSEIAKIFMLDRHALYGVLSLEPWKSYSSLAYLLVHDFNKLLLWTIKVTFARLVMLVLSSFLHIGSHLPSNGRS